MGSEPRFVVITRRRTARFTSYGLYDNERHEADPAYQTRDKAEARAEASRRNG